ncbi:MAG: ATP-dependent zinc metalloprotease FtsH [Clostridia bacterium]|nr:ATP-dependent zinc metalloprotease FtsH [Clostridia bacterium]
MPGRASGGRSKEARPLNRARLRTALLYLLVIALVIVLAMMINPGAPEPHSYNYSTFMSYVDQGRVKSVDISSDGTSVTGVLTDGTSFSSTIPEGAQSLTVEKLMAKGVAVRSEKAPTTPWYAAVLSTVIPIAIVVIAFFFIMQQTQGGGSRVLQFGKARARLHQDDPKKRVTFDDVAGLDEAKEELQEIVDFLKHPKRYTQLGARIPKGVLLYGAPGTGKTLLARAVAGEAGVPFFSISGSDFVEMFVGVGASRVRDLFETAKKNAPCIVFIDEIDAVGRQRGAGYGGGHDEREQTLNQLLVEMDGFSANEGIIVIAATNRPDVLDPALLRPGRFDRQIVVDRPDLKGREAIIRVHLRGKPVDPSVDPKVLARRTPGFTGADIENMVNEAALLTARRGEKRISMEAMEEAIDRIVAGGPAKRSRVISDQEKRVVAYHEAGHALVGKLLPGFDPIHKVTIVPRGPSLGVTMQLPLEDRYLVTRGEVLNQITWALAGRAAEELVFGEVTSGATNDMERSTQLARRMITEFGMSRELGPMTFGNKIDNPFLGRDLTRDRSYSEEVAAAIDREIADVVNECYERAKQLLRAHRHQLDELANRLLEKETVEGAELEEILRGKVEAV